MLIPTNKRWFVAFPFYDFDFRCLKSMLYIPTEIKGGSFQGIWLLVEKITYYRNEEKI